MLPEIRNSIRHIYDNEINSYAQLLVAARKAEAETKVSKPKKQVKSAEASVREEGEEESFSKQIEMLKEELKSIWTKDKDKDENKKKKGKKRNGNGNNEATSQSVQVAQAPQVVPQVVPQVIAGQPMVPAYAMFNQGYQQPFYDPNYNNHCRGRGNQSWSQGSRGRGRGFFQNQRNSNQGGTKVPNVEFCFDREGNRFPGCFHCGEQGHWKNACPSLNQQGIAQGGQSNPKEEK
jgi:hypothetical protein